MMLTIDNIVEILHEGGSVTLKNEKVASEIYCTIRDYLHAVQHNKDSNPLYSPPPIADLQKLGSLMHDLRPIHARLERGGVVRTGKAGFKINRRVINQ